MIGHNTKEMFAKEMHDWSKSKQMFAKEIYDWSQYQRTVC